MEAEGAGQEQTTALVWAAPEQAELAREIARRCSMHVSMAGCEGAVGEGSAKQLAHRLGCAAFDDLRHALASAQVDVALLLHSGPETIATLRDRETLRACRERRVRVLSLAPSPGSVADAAAAHEHGLSDVAAFLPRVRWSSGYRAASGVFDAFGAARTLAISARCAPHEGTLGARLVDAMDVVLALFGEPDLVDASIIAPDGSTKRKPGVEAVGELVGDLAGHLRYADGRAVSLSLSNRGGRWFRGVTAIGDRGCLRIDEGAFEWLGGRGERIDASAGAGREPSAAEAIAEQAARLLDIRTQPDAPVDMVRALAMAEAAALSARTGQPESPATLRRMAGAE